MDINSVEFYTLAFVVAMALVALLMGHKQGAPASTCIVQLGTSPVGEEADDEADALVVERLDEQRVRLSRRGLCLAAEETVNLVFTVTDDACTIVEKKGIKRRGQPPVPVTGEVVVKCLRPVKYRIRFESQVTSGWAMFTLSEAVPSSRQVALRL